MEILKFNKFELGVAHKKTACAGRIKGRMGKISINKQRTGGRAVNLALMSFVGIYGNEINYASGTLRNKLDQVI